MLDEIFLVAIGGFFGAVARYYVTRALTKNFRGTFPHATLFVNVLGTYVFGFLVGIQMSATFNLLLGIGFFGAFTTFSTINVELVKFMREKNWVFFINYAVLTYLFGIVLARAGFMTASLLLELKML